MTLVVPSGPHSKRLPKSLRLLKSQDFKFKQYRRFHSEWFTFVYCLEGKGRLGVSLSKKALRRAVWRNRVRRLLREVFRLNHDDFAGMDLHVIGKNTLTEVWRDLSKADVEREFVCLLEKANRGSSFGGEKVH